MVRLMLVLAPVMCILSGIAVSSSLSNQVKYLDAPKTSQAVPDKRSKKAEASTPFRSEVAWAFTVLMALFLVTSCHTSKILCLSYKERSDDNELEHEQFSEIPCNSFLKLE